MSGIGFGSQILETCSQPAATCRCLLYPSILDLQVPPPNLYIVFTYFLLEGNPHQTLPSSQKVESPHHVPFPAPPTFNRLCLPPHFIHRNAIILQSLKSITQCPFPSDFIHTPRQSPNRSSQALTLSSFLCNTTQLAYPWSTYAMKPDPPQRCANSVMRGFLPLAFCLIGK